MAFVHFAVPFRRAGSETMLHALLQALRCAGHDVTVVTTDTPTAPQRWGWEGLQGWSCNSPQAAAAKVRDEHPDIIVTHHQNTGLALDVARYLGVKSVFLMHNDFDLNKRLLAKRPDLVVFNTDWIAARYADRVSRSIVVHPPVWPDQHATTPGDAVTLVNLNEDKGAPLFYELARRLHDVPFLGVTGAHGHQVTITRRNLTTIPPTQDMRSAVWSHTRVLLMPSYYESYGMVGVEAAASGIPVIANPTPGLCESLGPAGIWVPRGDVDEWEAQLRRLLDDTEAWDEASARALARSAELHPAGDLDRWTAALTALYEEGPDGIPGNDR